VERDFEFKHSAQPDNANTSDETSQAEGRKISQTSETILARKQAKKSLQKENQQQEKLHHLEKCKRKEEEETRFEKRRNQERDVTIKRESEERRRKEIRRSQNSIGAIPPDEIKREVRGSAGGEGEVDPPQEKETPKPQTQENILASIKKQARTDITTLEDKQALPRSIIECLAKWVVCHDVQAESKNKRSNVVWDTLGSMKKHQDVWKAREMCVGTPRAAADVGGELEVTSMLGENTLQLEKSAAARMKLGRPFAILVPTANLRIFKAIWGEFGKDNFQYIHILRPYETGKYRFCIVTWLCWGLKIPGGEVFAESPSIFLTEIEGERGFFMGQTGASRPMSTHRMVRALAGEIAEMKERKSKLKKKAAKIKKIELVRFLATAPKTEIAQHQKLCLNSC
jgi:hypothetical protein